MMKQLTMAGAAVAVTMVAACGEPVTQAPAPPKASADAAPVAAPASVAGLPAGAYKIDPSHTALLFQVSHLGFSQYTGRFDKVDADLQLDPANPSAAQLTVTVDPASLGLPAPPPGFVDELKGAQWLDAAKFPAITFKSTAVTTTGPDTADITGDLTLHGVTKPIVLKAKFNGGYPGHPMDPNARIGFTATGTFNRSDFGIAFGIPAPGTTMGVGDAVKVMVETEFSGPPLPAAAAAAATPAPAPAPAP